MNYEFDFQKDKDFLNNSPTFKELKDEVHKREETLSSLDKKLVSASLKLWGESVLKHNLSINTTRIDHINLISDENSNEVLNVFGKIMDKNKDKRTSNDYKVLQNHSLMESVINLACFNLEARGVDVFSQLKNEYVHYKNNIVEKTKPKDLVTISAGMAINKHKI